MRLDVATIIISGLGCLIGLIYMFLFPKKWTTFLGSLRIFLIGLLFLFVTTISNSLIEAHWNMDYIINFMSLKEVGDWLFRVIASFGYIFMIWGAVGMLVKKFVKR